MTHVIVPMKNGYFIGGIPHFQTYLWMNPLWIPYDFPYSVYSLPTILPTDSVTVVSPVSADLSATTEASAPGQILRTCQAAMGGFQRYPPGFYWESYRKS